MLMSRQLLLALGVMAGSLAGLPLRAQQQEADVRQLDAARQFVHAFYDWYVPIASRDGREVAVRRALRAHPELFSPNLRRLLVAEMAAPDSMRVERMGIDFDPFLGAPDPCAHYRIWNPTKDIPVSWRFLVAGDCVRPPQRPVVAILVALEEGRWVIRDFAYPGTRVVSLRDALATRARERAALSRRAKPR